MNIDIRRNITEKLKNDSEKDIINTINEGVVNGDELVLPGLGVMLEFFWNELQEDEKLKLAKIIKNKLRKE